MDYAGLLSQKRAEESRFRSGWDPIGSPSGLSRAGGNSYLGGGGLMAAESAVRVCSEVSPIPPIPPIPRPFYPFLAHSRSFLAPSSPCRR